MSGHANDDGVLREAGVEAIAVEILRSLGYAYAEGRDLYEERGESLQKVTLEPRLRSAMARINRDLPSGAIERAARQVLLPQSPSTEENNQAFQRMLRGGVTVEVGKGEARLGKKAWLVDFESPDNNDWLVVGQLTITAGGGTRAVKKRRPDLVVYLNGLPIAVIELKSPHQEKATVEGAYRQLQVYKEEIPQLFDTNELLVVSDGITARTGSLTARYNRFAPWRTMDGSQLAAKGVGELSVLMRGLFEKRRLLDYIRNFVLWEADGAKLVKKNAGYHQYLAVNRAVTQTLRAIGAEASGETPLVVPRNDSEVRESGAAGDRHVGVVWHTQGSGKSISMVFYVGKLVQASGMKNPTVVVLTDRNDLDGQLFAQFAAASDIVGQPVQAESREDLKTKLEVASGGVVFTTIQKFGTDAGEHYPLLSARENIVVVADEAHRSQYATIKGFARNLRDALPNASFLGFTGTPIDFSDRNTRTVFGGYIDVYPVRQAVEDGATVPIFYESRVAQLDLPDDNKSLLDVDFDQVTEGAEDSLKSKLKSRWAKLEAMVGGEERLEVVAKDLVEHYERRGQDIQGKAMIVTMSRRIAVLLYDAIIKLRPDWHSDDDDKGAIKVVMTGTPADPEAFKPHIRRKVELKNIEKRFKERSFDGGNDDLRLVIVRDMWLTGFNAPSVHTIYVDKPMKGHGFMQAITRANRVYPGKEAGLVVDYLGLAERLRNAVNKYDGNDDSEEEEQPNVDEAARILREKVSVLQTQFHGFDYKPFLIGSGANKEQHFNGVVAGANFLCGSKVAPLDEAELAKLALIYADFKHPRSTQYRQRKDRAAQLPVARARIARLVSFAAADIGTEGDEALYDNVVGALHTLLQEADQSGEHRAPLSGPNSMMALQVEPLLRKLFVRVAPKQAKKHLSLGLGGLITQMGKLGLSPYEQKISDDAFVMRDGGDAWAPLEHAMCDQMAARLDVSHRSKDLPDGLWRSSLFVMLEFIRHNTDKLGGLPDLPVGKREGRKRFMDAMAQLEAAAGIAGHREDIRPLRDEIAYFRDVRNVLLKTTGGPLPHGMTQEQLNAQIQQIVSNAVTSDGIIDLFADPSEGGGIPKASLAILDDAFIAKLGDGPNKNLQVEVLQRLLNDEIKAISRTNMVRGKKFSAMLDATLKRYKNGKITQEQAAEEQRQLAKEVMNSAKKGEALGLSDDEMAFYEALASHESAESVMGDASLAEIAKKVTESIRKSVTIDWTEKEAVRAAMRSRIRKVLRRSGYPPDKAKSAMVTVLEQAEHVCGDWAEAG